MSEAAEPHDALRVDIRRGNPTDEEVAAVIAVVGAAYAQEADAATAAEARRPDAWQVSARGLRQPLRRDIPWGRFAGR
ncbi:acyl-CoA carboxylase epsilon subunit [Microbacterium sp. SORGH_AS_0888]|uniref:acyl-CoA carboxylase epsilon subunit n=1 Tax=Microbacterium sp. SORGH_AS_0888 TaxID=3041791 RepID=UPI00278470E4|nr:acyl-CoA carboxylase epsilon subunit [Microbacterium sp. SORGH_AS_0888]MDQ1131396.1 hypothetical protein [Microbacterium sp. SORGH_AS_0888]